MGVDGRVARDSPQPVDNIGDGGELEGGSVYSFQITKGVFFFISPQLISNLP